MSPIRPENRDRYPADWPAISRRIRHDRAGDRCECLGECGRGTHIGRCPNRNGQAAYGTGSKVVLTVAHLNHTPEDCDDDNLKAMCQGCHLHYDKEHHAETASATRHEARLLAGQGVLELASQSSPLDLGDTSDDMVRTAEISADGRYRYMLGRSWAGGPRATFVMLNPSTADAFLDDPTIRRCTGFARAWGLGGITVVNLYAWRSTDPAALWTADDPVGPENDRWLRRAALAPGPMVAAWGANARPDRIARALAVVGHDRLECLGLTKAGQPRHPLYLRADSERAPWTALEAAS